MDGQTFAIIFVIAVFGWLGWRAWHEWRIDRVTGRDPPYWTARNAWFAGGAATLLLIVMPAVMFIAGPR